MTALVDRLEQAEATATPGPWEADGSRILGLLSPDREEGGAVLFTSAALFDPNKQGDADAALIVELRNALPALLTALRAAHAYTQWLGPARGRNSAYYEFRHALATLFGEDTTP